MLKAIVKHFKMCQETKQEQAFRMKAEGIDYYSLQLFAVFAMFACIFDTAAYAVYRLIVGFIDLIVRVYSFKEK